MPLRNRSVPLVLVSDGLIAFLFRFTASNAAAQRWQNFPPLTLCMLSLVRLLVLNIAQYQDSHNAIGEVPKRSASGLITGTGAQLFRVFGSVARPFQIERDLGKPR